MYSSNKTCHLKRDLYTAKTYIQQKIPHIKEKQDWLKIFPKYKVDDLKTSRIPKQLLPIISKSTNIKREKYANAINKQVKKYKVPNI